MNELMNSAGIVLMAPYKNAESIYLNTPISSFLLFTSTNDKLSAESSYWLNEGKIIRTITPKIIYPNRTAEPPHKNAEQNFDR